MKTRPFAIAVISALTSLAGQALAQTAVPTAFTYQGRLENNGVLFEGSAELDIAAYDSASGGLKVGQQTVQTVNVVNGLFTVEFDPGLAAFEPNTALWIEVKVRAGNSGPFTTLPRQKLTATPFSSATRGLYVTGSGVTARLGLGASAPAGFRFSVDETTNNPSLINIDSGQSTAQVSGFQLADRGAGQWTFGKNSQNNFFFDRAGVNPVQLVLGSSTAQDDSDWSTELVLRGRDAATGAQGTSGIIFQNSNISAQWEMGQSKDGVLRFTSQGPDVKNWISVPAIEIRGGSDIAEPYDVAPAGEIQPAPGMVVSIDPDRVGKLRVSTGSYDRMVAGIISGANGVNAGLTLTQEGSVADGQLPIAKVGRVWCLVDADAAGAVTPGDLLTTSSTAGHAQKVSDFAKSQGAILGKAMSSLPSGRGYVLVLVGLQ